MIARAPYLFLLLIVIPDLYFDLHYWRHRYSSEKRLIWWLPGICMIAYTLVLTYEPNFIPDNPTILYIYLLLLGLIIIPKLVFMICSIVGLGFSKLLRKIRHRNKPSHYGKNYGNLVGLFLVPVIWFILLYGSFIGFEKMEVNRQIYESPDIPAAFNGYKIVMFSDAHVGTYDKKRQWILQRAIDSINAQHPDLIVFTGDLQNIRPQEIEQHQEILSKLKAKDGVYSVLGNHDYAQYVNCDEAQKAANCRETIRQEELLGWTLLRNEHRTISHKRSHIIIAGMENDGDGRRFPQKGNIKKTLKGVSGKDFTILLEHDPSSWHRRIIPDGRAQLTLSGHTHNMQFSIFGWSPLSLTGKEVNGWYHDGQQSLFVTAGLGGLIPFRFGATGEIVVLTLSSTR
ncbi:MAG: metallophosphoesterase [Prevotella sp.]|nr:metallophosphoesterase [Prevotella sp.]